MSQPLVAILAARGERVTVAALPWVAPVYRAMPEVAEVVEMALGHGRLDLAERRRIAAGWRGRFDVAYVLPNSLKAALIPWLARVPLRIGYLGESRHVLLNRRLPNPPGRPPMVAFYRALAALGAPAAAGSGARAASASRDDDAHAVATGHAPRLHVDRDRAAALLDVHELQAAGYWAFAPGAEYGSAKRWPAEHYAELARSLHARSGAPVVLLGSRQERELCEALAAGAPGACRVLAGVTSLDDSIALIAAARGVASNDSGLMHVAAAFGIPQVAMFGSTSPLHTPPLNPHARVLWLKDELQLDCAPCFDRECRFGHTRCLVGIEPARVERALGEALAGVRRGSHG
ncbi:lipopolysaccharide heptosyltransferase II [Schlegelella koreensis]|uniref:lipopolysaccharide heptosyltransferase II n=1 Tax=Piscinibacter koreensis TaxID=2742824 RepID=A0A7Y6NJK0_9BURK|nr:lipopolysaccharide heptosyltransferase II [Schlegelella koreensis]